MLVGKNKILFNLILSLAICATAVRSDATGLKTQADPFLTPRLKKALLFVSGTSDKGIRDYIKKLAGENGFVVDEGKAAAFTAANLSNYQLAIFASDYTINFNATQKKDFENWYRKGNGAICIHACGRGFIQDDWPWYGQVLGGTLKNHTPITKGMVHIDEEGKNHPILSELGTQSMTWTDEWFYWRKNPRGSPGLTVLLNADKSLFTGSHQQTYDDYPHAWVKESDGGRFFYWAGLHTKEAIEIPFIQKFMLNAVHYIAGSDTIRTGCMNPGFKEFNRYATISTPGACQSPVSLKAIPQDLGNAFSLSGNSIQVSLNEWYLLRVTMANGTEVLLKESAGPGNFSLPENLQQGIYFISFRTKHFQVQKRVVTVGGVK